ncbi:unnamed protein product [Linum tenue]|uniref:AT-hook motif nuclear-localized protein n=1 Tax=Linum tenue TaxID=586396 RepID=A0AAV0HJP2_9ROSI|nr:unnamed protein product [Linum tenue]
METREGLSSGVTVIGAETPSNYHVAQRSENPNQVGVGVPQHQQQMVLSSPVSGGGGEKKKRGRPRKYAPDGVGSRALSPLPISASAPPASTVAGDYSNSHSVVGKPSKVLSAGYEKKKHKKIGMENLGLAQLANPNHNAVMKLCQMGSLLVQDDWGPQSVGTNFTPHVIPVNAGEVCASLKVPGFCFFTPSS